MGLSITVGILADLIENDPEGAEFVRDELDVINEVLRQHGLPIHEEPTSLPSLENRSELTDFPYSFLHYLWRFYARRIAYPDQIPPPVVGIEALKRDPVPDKIASPAHHLLWHADGMGYYVPIDFPKVLEDRRIAGAGVGSSVRLRDELIGVAAPLGITLHDGQLSDADATALAEEPQGEGPYWIERLVWLTLFEAARLSIEHGAAIHFG